MNQELPIMRNYIARDFTIILCLALLLLSGALYITYQQHQYRASAATLEPTTGYEMIQHPVPNGSSWPFELATDNLGRVWVVEQLSNQLGMFDPTTSSWTEYTLPTPNSTANSVSVDSSGNVWVTELTSNKLAELKNGSTKIIEIDIPARNFLLGSLSAPLTCGPVEVISSASGSIWILCLFSNQIDEYFPNNSTFDQFNLPIWESGPADLVFDSSDGFYFTAADANMLGHGVLSELQNGTSDGITEFAPTNQTYTFTFQHQTSLLGNTSQITSSLPTPAGIAISPDGSTLWVTEHVDSSFDSYNLASKSLDRFWLSKTYMEYGYPVAFPNGIAIDSNGNVWMAEHYGNKIAEFNPTTRNLIEYAVPCCSSTPYQSPGAGVYWLTLGKGGTVWFVEVYGDAIGELKPVNSTESVSITSKSTSVSFAANQHSSINVPIEIQYSGLPAVQSVMKLDAAGVSANGSIIGAYAGFSRDTYNISGTGAISNNFTMRDQSLKPGIYAITLSANFTNSNTIYSTVLEIDVTTSPFPTYIIYAAIVGIVAAIAVIVVMSRRRNIRRRR